MLYSSGKLFREEAHKAITLLGMSGVGKTMLADKLPNNQWFHYSADYRIGTKYLEEEILDNIKRQAMTVPFLKELLLSDSIYICSNITVNNLSPLSTFLGKIGYPGLVTGTDGGLSYAEFRRRQDLHAAAEIRSMEDVDRFIRKGQEIYNYANFINDASGSLCEIVDPFSGNDPILADLSDRSVLLYIRATEADYKRIEQAAMKNPKPLFYRDDFLREQIALYRVDKGLPERKIEDIADIIPDDFVKWIFPRLWAHRIPRYQAIADRYGYCLDANDAASVRDEEDLVDVIADAIDKRQAGQA